METRPTELGRPTAQGATVGLSDGDRDWDLSVNRFCFARTSDGFVWLASR